MAIVLDGTLGLTYTGDTAASNNLAVPGNVGVGTSSPEAKLDVRGSSTFLVNQYTQYFSTSTPLLQK